MEGFATSSKKEVYSPIYQDKRPTAPPRSGIALVGMDVVDPTWHQKYSEFASVPVGFDSQSHIFPGTDVQRGSCLVYCHLKVLNWALLWFAMGVLGTTWILCLETKTRI